MNKQILSLALCSLFSIGAALAVPVAQDQAAPQGGAMQGPEHGHGRQMDPEKELAHMTKALNLTADQQSQIKPILSDRQQKMQGLWSDTSLSRDDRMAKAKSIREESNAKIEAVLTADQKPKFEQMQQRGREHHQHTEQQ